VTDQQLARLVAMDIPVVIQLDGAADWLLSPEVLADFDRDSPINENGWLTRWRDFVDAGLHVASATDAPWTFPDFEPGDRRVELTDDVGRPVDQVAAGMDGRLRLSAETPPWLSDQILTAEHGLRAVTTDAAYALGDEARRGRLAPSMLGDVTILSGDVPDGTPDEIRAMTIVATIVGGALAYCQGAEICSALEHASP
jgi:predicted amidohydrolase YtcJ